MSGKITNFFKTAARLNTGSLVEYYKMKYLNKADNSVHSLGMKNGLKLNVNKNEGDLCTLFEVFIDEDYAFKGEENGNYNIIDIGANVGYFSLYISKKYPNSKVFSFEPFPETFKKLSSHISSNNISNVKLNNLAVSDFDDTAKFYSFEWTGCNTMVDRGFDEEQTNVTEVKCIKFESLRELTGCENFDFAKIDCEGSEYPIILNSSDEAVKAVKKYIIEVHTSEKYSVNDLVNRFKELGYKTKTTSNLLIAEI